MPWLSADDIGIDSLQFKGMRIGLRSRRRSFRGSERSVDDVAARRRVADAGFGGPVARSMKAYSPSPGELLSEQNAGIPIIYLPTRRRIMKRVITRGYTGRIVVSRSYFFNAACQLSTTVIGTVDDRSTGVAIRKRPSRSRHRWGSNCVARAAHRRALSGHWPRTASRSSRRDLDHGIGDLLPRQLEGVGSRRTPA